MAKRDETEDAARRPGTARQTARTATGGRAPGDRPPPKPSAGQTALEWVRSLVVAVVLFLLIRTFLVQTFTITSGSMIPTLLVGDWLMISKVTYGPQIPFTHHARIPGYRQPRLNDVVVFRPPAEPDLDVVKRVVAVAGDTIQMRGGKFYRDGKFADGPWVIHTDPNDDQTHPWMVWQKRYLVKGVNPATYQPTRDNWGPLVVPPGNLFVMGDNRDDSLDSRYWGWLPIPDVEGNVMFIYYSYDTDSTRPLPFLTAIRWNRIGDIPK